MSQEDVVFNLELNVEPSIQSLRQVEGLAFRTLGYMQRLGLPENVNQAIRVIQQLTMAARMAHTAIIALEVAAGPISWWRAILAVVGTGFAAYGALEGIEGMYDQQRGTS